MQLTLLIELSGIELSGVAPKISGDVGVNVTGIAQDSRLVRPGFVFVAIRGGVADGAAYAAQAAKSGAVAIVAESGAIAHWPDGVVRVEVENARLALARLAAAFYPSQPQHCVAVTGTNGKTSTAEFYRQLWEIAGYAAASIGTLGLRCDKAAGDIDYPQGHTSPDPVLLHRTLSELAAHEVQHLCVEASSHGLHQHRLDGMKLEGAAFTNLTHDHLDYHGDMESYFAAKARLFSEFGLSKKQVAINADDASFDALSAMAKQAGNEVLGFGRTGKFIVMKAVEPVPQGLLLDWEIAGEPCRVQVPLYGMFQAYNICSAASLAYISGMSTQQIIAYLPQLKGVRGRMERAAIHPSGAPMFVDYAHTPDALENVLKSLRPHCAGRLWVVFGCGGDRDAAKRPMMGALAMQHADGVVVTDDNPRSEEAAAIRAQVMATAGGANEIGDRAKAIAFAAQQLQRGDVLVVAGKGHETYQIIGDKTHHFDDAEKIREVIRTS